MTGKHYVKKEKKNTYCLVCRKKIHKKKNNGVVLVNKIATQRLLCTDCTSRNSTFSKPLKPIKSKNSFHKL